MGAEISAERSDKGIEDDLHKIIGVCDACFKDTANAGQIEEVLNGIVSMLALVTGEKSENLIVAFCEKLTKAPSNIIGMTCLKVLWSLYQSLDTESPMRFHVYHALVILAGRTKHIDTVYKVRKINSVLRSLHILHIEAKAFVKSYSSKSFFKHTMESSYGDLVYITHLQSSKGFKLHALTKV